MCLEPSHPRFEGTSGMGPRGDAILLKPTGVSVNCITRILKKIILLENTLIILSSDNGPVLNDGYYDEAVEKLRRLIHQQVG
jgi:hypothetical protein